MKQVTLEDTAHLCPACGAEDSIEGDSVTIDCGKAYQTCTCLDCGAEWEDVYTLVSRIPL